MVSRLAKVKESEVSNIPEARDFAAWKKRHCLAPDTKVFGITGWYPAIKAALEARNWFYNSDRDSPFFDLKWTLKSDDLKQFKLDEHQVAIYLIAIWIFNAKYSLINLAVYQSFHAELCNYDQSGSIEKLTQVSRIVNQKQSVLFY